MELMEVLTSPKFYAEADVATVENKPNEMSVSRRLIHPFDGKEAARLFNFTINLSLDTSTFRPRLKIRVRCDDMEEQLLCSTTLDDEASKTWQKVWAMLTQKAYGDRTYQAEDDMKYMLATIKGALQFE